VRGRCAARSRTLIEDVLAEHLLLGRYPSGSTIVVDGQRDDGLVIQAGGAEDPRRSLVGRQWRGPRAGSSGQACGADFPRWEGQCRSCAAWNTLVETVVTARQRATRRGVAREARRPRPSPLSPRPTARPSAADRPRRARPRARRRHRAGLAAADRRRAGVGKSTLLLQVAGGVAAAGGGVLYATGEESPARSGCARPRSGWRRPRRGRRAVLATSEVGAIVEAARATRRPRRRRFDPDDDRRGARRARGQRRPGRESRRCG
jgi:hypothetical protein